MRHYFKVNILNWIDWSFLSLPEAFKGHSTLLNVRGVTIEVEHDYQNLAEYHYPQEKLISGNEITQLQSSRTFQQAYYRLIFWQDVHPPNTR